MKMSPMSSTSKLSTTCGRHSSFDFAARGSFDDVYIYIYIYIFNPSQKPRSKRATNMGSGGLREARGGSGRLKEAVPLSKVMTRSGECGEYS